MDKKKIKKYLAILISGIIIILGIKVGYSCTYVGDIIVTYPWEEYTLSEKAASILMGYGKADTKQQLYDQGLINSDKLMYQKFNDSYYKDNSTEINSNFNKSELENMYINPEKYIDKDFTFKGKIFTDLGLNEQQKQIISNISKDKDNEKKIINDIEGMDKEIIIAKIDNTNVSVLMFYDKNKINYDKWKKESIINVQGKIKSVKKDTSTDTETITIYDNPTIK